MSITTDKTETVERVARGTCHWCGDGPDGEVALIRLGGREWHECPSCLADIVESDLSDPRRAGPEAER